MLNRVEALQLLKNYVKNDKIIKHCLAVEAIMRKLANKFNEDEELWGLAGLLHDIDYELTAKDLSKHGIIAEEILKDKVPKKVLDAIKAHNELTGFNCETKMSYALKASDQVSGLIIATALVMPSKKLAEVKVNSLIKKFKQKDFARSVNREEILLCEKLGIPLKEFMEISLKALQEIKEVLSL